MFVKYNKNELRETNEKTQNSIPTLLSIDATGIKLLSSIAIQFLHDYSQILYSTSDSDQHFADHHQLAYHCSAALIGRVDSYAQ